MKQSERAWLQIYTQGVKDDAVNNWKNYFFTIATIGTAFLSVIWFKSSPQ